MLLFFVVGCNANGSFIDPIKPEFETMSFDVVEKKLIFEEKLPEHIQKLISNWFDEKVKINKMNATCSSKINKKRETQTNGV